MLKKGAVLGQTCWHCHRETLEGTSCEHCQKIQPFAKQTDYFTALGLKRRMQLDLKDLEKRFHGLSRRFHPDFFQNKSQTEQEISLANSAVINNAYRALREPVSRAEYLVQLVEGGSQEIPLTAPADFLEEILELQETLGEYRLPTTDGGDDRDRLRESLVSALTNLQSRDKVLMEGLQESFVQWDALPENDGEAHQAEVKEIVKKIKEILSHRAYLKRVMNDIQKALEQPTVEQG